MLCINSITLYVFVGNFLRKYMANCRLPALLTCKAKTDNDFRENIAKAAI